MPFEVFMERVLKDTRADLLLSLFSLGEPNANHILLARLAKHGYISVIVTTNFDMLIECALQLENVNYRSIFAEHEFSTVDLASTDQLMLVKIHGSAEDIGSIRATMDQIATRSLLSARATVVNHVFSGRPHELVLVIGYSCSDVIDLIPQIEAVSGRRKRVVLIEHDTKHRTRRPVKARVHPFGEYEGTWLICDTDRFVRDLWQSNWELGAYPGLRNGSCNWGQHVKDWRSSMSRGHQHLTMGMVWDSLSRTNEALRSFCAAAEDYKASRSFQSNL